ncbi:ribosomal protein S21e, partial [Coemansia mojavensis]
SDTNRLISTKGHASVQISIADVNEEGVVAGSVKTYAVSGIIHDRDESDNSIDRLATQDGHPQNVWSYQR